MTRAAGWCFLILLAACGQLKENPQVNFVMREFARESSPGCETDSIVCARFRLSYPVFSGVDSAVQKSLEERIAFWLGGGSGADPRAIPQLADDFIRDFQQFLSESPDYGLGWYFDGVVEPLITSDTLISLQVNSESFTGGAHGSYSTNFVNVDPATGTAYLLDALLKAGYEDELNKLAAEDLSSQRIDTDSTGTSDQFPANFKLNDNYGFRKEGIVFFFNTYEIGSYAEGPTEILIPYEKLRDWMR